MPHTFVNTPHFWQHYVTHPCCQPLFPIPVFLTIKMVVTEMVKFHLVVRQQASSRTPAVDHGLCNGCTTPRILNLSASNKISGQLYFPATLLLRNSPTYELNLG